MWCMPNLNGVCECADVARCREIGYYPASRIKMRYPLQLICACFLPFVFTGCGGTTTEGKGATPTPPILVNNLDQEVGDLISENALTGDPATPRNLSMTRPNEDPLVKLGQQLFFSQTLSGSFDVACATCHLPHLGGSDGLSLSVGVVPIDRRITGPARKVDISKDQDARADGGPNMHRNSITTFNAGLMDRVLMFDGRIRVSGTEPEVVAGGHGQLILTPESGSGGDLSGIDNLLDAVSKFPITNDNEMRGYLYADISAPDAFRNHLVDRYRGRADQLYMSEQAVENWLALFRNGLGQGQASADELITLVNIQKALGAFVRSQTFVDTPWSEYIEGQQDSISDQAKRGAKLFYTNLADDGLGCSTCHSGDVFSDEKFYNVGFPQIGRGSERADGSDAGRWMVSRSQSDWYAHRVPSLLNVALTAPYGHAGTFESLEALLSYHANPRQGGLDFDFSLDQLPQFSIDNISYPLAEENTTKVINHSSFLQSEPYFPNRHLSEKEIQELVAFLNTLTDVCAGESSCRSAWVPTPNEDPDGHMLGANNGPAPNIYSDPLVIEPSDYPDVIEINWSNVPLRQKFSDVIDCADGLASSVNDNTSQFLRKDVELGLTSSHGFSLESWSHKEGVIFQLAMFSGGISATYLNDDCWPDILFSGGDDSGLIAYESLGDQEGFSVNEQRLSATNNSRQYKKVTGTAVVDIDGDYHREVLLGNFLQGDLIVLGKGSFGNYGEISRLPMKRNTFGMSFGDIDKDGFLDMYFAHWDGYGVDGTAPAMWQNESGLSLRPNDIAAGTSSATLNQEWNFTPKFADLRNSGNQDLLISSDFGTSSILENMGQGEFEVVTASSDISDENGMGGALGDIDNDGLLDWFVTSIFDPNGVAEGNWGVTGNRLYKNNSTLSDISFIDMTALAGIDGGEWGWGACMSDFNSDGFLDIFHVNGFGYVPEELDDSESFISILNLYQRIAHEFIGTPPKLFINAGDGTFSDQAHEWGLDIPSEGRGVICFDYDRDGDIDIGLLDHSVGIQFFENQTGHGDSEHFLNIRLVGEQPNTDAIGAKVYVTANVGGEHGLQRQMRISEANSNFNSQNLPDIHFGMGEASVAVTLRIEWPDHSGLVCVGVKTNQFLVFDQRDRSWPKLGDGQPLCAWYLDIREIVNDLVTP